MTLYKNLVLRNPSYKVKLPLMLLRENSRQSGQIFPLELGVELLELIVLREAPDSQLANAFLDIKDFDSRLDVGGED